VFTYRNADRASYVWVDLESWHSDWERKVMAVVEELGRRCLELGDCHGATWAGLRGREAAKTDASPRGVLMKAHLAKGDAEAAALEFESYTRPPSMRLASMMSRPSWSNSTGQPGIGPDLLQAG
jgi:hypothetical protein